ncbi:MAG: N-acetyl-gamma-glutamyl-phosphate reductase [Planctomycetes bacterium]|nr:N-acetyl-gamma-glutamyl-phosphate reductase [Planctomycetota bacterium]
MVRVAIEGASGYSGIELTRILAGHPGVELVGVASGRWDGDSIRERTGLPGPAGRLCYRKSLLKAELEVEAVLCATPANASQELIPAWIERGVRVVDLSNAFREEACQADSPWVYGLSEHAREAIKATRLVANPGCYPTATQNALLPLITAGLIAPGPLVIDAKSGVTGAGRSTGEHLLYNEMADNHYPYRVGSHQHVPELERGLGRELLFTPHLLPTRRGLFVSCYVPVVSGTSAADLEACLRERYADEPFVQVVSADRALGVRDVVGTPLVRVAVGSTIKAGLARVFGCLDNLLKGAASQATQNLNLCLGLPETQGLI